MRKPTRPPGWDAQAIGRIAEQHYGGLAPLFEAHSWPERGSAMMPAQQRRIADLYGSIEAFERAHSDGLGSNLFLNPLAAIERHPPEVWLTSYYGFAPQEWGFLGFTHEWMRKRFVRESAPGSLVVIYGANGAPDPRERKRILGVQQQTHSTGWKQDFVPPERWANEQVDQGRRDKWKYGLKVWRTWRVTPESRMDVRDFAPETYSAGRATSIGAIGMRLTPSDARNLLKLDLVEVPFYGGLAIDALRPGSAERLLSPSRPGPVSQSPFIAKEAEGPKHLYILRLKGDADKLLGYDAGERMIVKVGFSRSPETRCEAHNKALPSCAFEWCVEHSTFAEGREPFPSSGCALAGEQAMKEWLGSVERSLGGEFFLAGRESIDDAWRQAIKAAENWTP